jgi:tRNA_anti-like
MPRYDDDDDRPRRRRGDDDDRPRARRRLAWDDEDDYEDFPRRRRARPRAKEMSVLGAIGLGVGVVALLVAFMPWFASKALIPAGIGLVIGFIALVMAQKSDGRQGYGMPIAAMSASVVAVLIGVSWLFLGKQLRKEFNREPVVVTREDREFAAEIAKEEARRKVELAQAAQEVQAGGNVIRVSAFELARAYDQDDDRADALYSGKVLEVTGQVEELDLTGETYTVLLKGIPDDSVNCEFAKDPAVRARLVQLKPGDTVTIRGKCPGSSTLEACILVE